MQVSLCWIYIHIIIIIIIIITITIIIITITTYVYDYMMFIFMCYLCLEGGNAGGADGIGTPDPNLIKISKLVFLIEIS